MAATTTLYIDSRAKSRGSHFDFRVHLPEQVTLRGARMRVDGIRTTDTFTTVSSRNKYAYFYDGAQSLTWVTLTEGAYTGAAFATELSAKSGRTCVYVASTNSLIMSYDEATRIVWDDAELRSIDSAMPMPADATPLLHRSINDILGEGVVEGSEIYFPFITMAPLQDLYLCSHHLMVHQSWMPFGQRHALAKVSLPGGFGTTVQGATPENVWCELGEYVTLKEVDFQLRDYRGMPVPLRAPISFILIFETY